MVMLPEARAPEGQRWYAIGDVHGCLASLRAVEDWIADDLAARPVADWRIILVGDYVDRGEDSAAVLAWIAERMDDPRHIFLIGNHDVMFAEFLRDSQASSAETWLNNGGLETAASYGVTADGGDLVQDAYAREGFRRALLEALPPAHLDVLDRLAFWARTGDYLFVHAGIRPGLPLESQEAGDLVWIREPFLSDDRDHGVVVIHGHTPGPAVLVRPNRIGIDTGAVFGGPLTCLVLEDATRAILSADGLRSLAEPTEGAAPR